MDVGGRSLGTLRRRYRRSSTPRPCRRVYLAVERTPRTLGTLGRLGFDVLYDGTRLVHLALPTQPGVGVWSFEAETAAQRERVGNRTGGAPLGVFYTDDCRSAAAQLRERGVVVEGVRESPEDASVQFEDCYGNRFVSIESKA